MNPAVFRELRKIKRIPNPTVDDIADRLLKLIESAPREDMPRLTAEIARLSDPSGEHFIPDVVQDTVRLLLEGRLAKLACDPWARRHTIALIVRQPTHARN